MECPIKSVIRGHFYFTCFALSSSILEAVLDFDGLAPGGRASTGVVDGPQGQSARERRVWRLSTSWWSGFLRIAAALAREGLAA